MLPIFKYVLFSVIKHWHVQDRKGQDLWQRDPRWMSYVSSKGTAGKKYTGELYEFNTKNNPL